MIFLLKNKVDRIFCAVALCLGIIAAAFDSIICAAAIIATYIIGALWGTQCIEYIQLNMNLFNDHVSSVEIKKNSCNVCGNSNCKRHQKFLYNTWVKVPNDFDAALENLFEQLLQTYVCTWYSDLSSNKAFIQQLRFAIATATRNITGRLLSANIPEIVFNHLVPVAIQHIQDWEELTKRAKTLGGKPQDYIVDYLGSKVHIATYSREAELNYLRGIATTLTPLLLPTTHISTNNRVILREILANWVLLPAIDALADPDNINSLIVLSTHYEGEFSQVTDAFFVPLLHAWVSSASVMQNTPNTLKPTLDEILNDQQLLYIFMQHIKESGPVNLLQFFLDIDDLSKRMLNPDITSEVEETLYIDAQNIYSSYLDPESINYVHLPLHVSEGMRQILEGGPNKIQELRTSRPLYQAHQEAHSLLENTCLPSFHHSYELYKLICGPSSVCVPTRSSSAQTCVSSGIGAKLTTQFGKIRGALRVVAVEGASFDTHQVYQAEEVSCTSRTYSDTDDKCNRDLTTWRVTIPHVDGGGPQAMYMIAVHSVAEDKSWTVLRRDQDFYALRARLAEFHGDRELNDSPLPTRKNQHPSLSANRQLYQDFLQKLLAKPTLRSSELLCTFLTVHNLKPYLSSYSASDIGVLYQSMTHKLRKERGQHLDKFMTTFLASTNIKSDYADVGVEIFSDQNFPDTSKKRRDLSDSETFGNNLNLDPRIRDFPYVTSKRQHAKGACFCVAEAVDSLLNFSPMKSRVIWFFASMVRQRLDPIINKSFHNVLVKLLSGGRAAVVVKLLHTTIFGKKHNRKDSLTQNANSERYNRARNGLHSLLPWWFIGAHSQWYKLMDAFLEPLQNAPFNKHLSYVLLDQLLINLYPELAMQSQMFG